MLTVQMLYSRVTKLVLNSGAQHTYSTSKKKMELFKFRSISAHIFQ